MRTRPAVLLATATVAAAVAARRLDRTRLQVAAAALRGSPVAYRVEFHHGKGLVVPAGSRGAVIAEVAVINDRFPIYRADKLGLRDGDPVPFWPDA